MDSNIPSTVSQNVQQTAATEQAGLIEKKIILQKTREHQMRNIILLGVICIFILLILLVYFKPGNLKFNGNLIDSYKKKATNSADLSVTQLHSSFPISIPTSVPSATPVNTPAASENPQFNLFFSTVNYSTATSKGEVVGAKIRLYSEAGSLLGEKTIPPVIVINNIGTGGNVNFSVPLGTYRAEASFDKLQGTTNVTIKSFSDQQYYSIYMYAKPILFSGIYCVDSNKNYICENGEATFPSKKITIFVRIGVPPQLYTIGSVFTDENGKFTYKLNDAYTGSYVIGAEQVLGYQELPQRWQDLSGGETITYDIVLWPL